MSLALKRIKVYLKLAVIVAVVTIILLVILLNQDNKANIWFFKRFEQVNILWLLVLTSAFSIVGWWAITKVFATLREFKEVRRAQAKEGQMAEQRRLAQELAEREKRIDEKLRKSISEE